VPQTVVVTKVVEKPVKDTILPFKYRPLGKPFDGKPVTLKFWDWSGPRMLLFERWFAKYTEVYPNVKFETSVVPWGDYWTKLKASIPAGQAPDMHFHHWGQSDVFVWGGLLEPLPEDLFPPSELEQTFNTLKTWQGPKGRYYWMPTGMMSGMIFYNKDIFKEAKVEAKDFPKTWDDMVTLGKRLTKYDTAGRVAVSGFNVNGFFNGLFRILYRQKGLWIWNKERTRPCYNQQDIADAIQWTVDLTEKHRLTDPDFLDYTSSFAAGKAAMILGWNWVAGNLKTNSPNIKFGSFPIPTWTGKFEPCAAEGSPDPASVVVASTTPLDRKKAALDVIAWLYSNPEFLLDNQLTFAVPPTTPQLANHPLLANDETITNSIPQMDYVIAGVEGLPLEGTTFNKWLVDGVFKQKMPIKDAMANCQKEMDGLVKEYFDTYKVTEVRVFEHQYKHADKMHWGKCLS
jgi:multiple sugar transport system substrate-binding protein